MKTSRQVAALVHSAWCAMLAFGGHGRTTPVQNSICQLVAITLMKLSTENLLSIWEQILHSAACTSDHVGEVMEHSVMVLHINWQKSFLLGAMTLLPVICIVEYHGESLNMQHLEVDAKDLSSWILFNSPHPTYALKRSARLMWAC